MLFSFPFNLSLLPITLLFQSSSALRGLVTYVMATASSLRHILGLCVLRSIFTQSQVNKLVLGSQESLWKSFSFYYFIFSVLGETEKVGMKGK